LAFLSVLNEDVYTRRNFEIPGMGGLMLSERTFELEKYFSEGKEAFFFSNKEELLEKVQLILADENLQQRVRFNAKNKSIEAGYDLDSRVYKLLADMNL
jgi:spore maturation protein CgeB